MVYDFDGHPQETGNEMRETGSMEFLDYCYHFNLISPLFS